MINKIREQNRKNEQIRKYKVDNNKYLKLDKDDYDEMEEYINTRTY